MPRTFSSLSRAELDEEVASATRGLGLDTWNADALERLIERHGRRPEFASQVLAEAAHRALDRLSLLP